MKTKIPADGLFLSNNQFWYSTGATNVKAFRCWFEFEAVLDKETDFGARIFLDFNNGESTGVKNIYSPTGSGKYYNLRGQEVKSPAKSIYVKDGKKVIIK